MLDLKERLNVHLLGYPWHIPSYSLGACGQTNVVGPQLLWQPESQRLLCSMEPRPRAGIKLGGYRFGSHQIPTGQLCPKPTQLLSQVIYPTLNQKRGMKKFGINNSKQERYSYFNPSKD